MPEERKMHVVIEVSEPLQMRIVITNEETYKIATNLLKSLGLIVFDKVPFQEAIKDVFNIEVKQDSKPSTPLPPDLHFKPPKLEWEPEEDLVIMSKKTAAEARNAYFVAFPESKRTKNAAYARFYALKNKKELPQGSVPVPQDVSPASPISQEEKPQDTVSPEKNPPPPLSLAATKKPPKKPQETLPAHVNSGKLPAKVGAPVKIVKGIYEGQIGTILKIKEGQALVDVGEEGKRVETWCLIKDEIVVTGSPEPVPLQTELHGIKLYDSVIQIKGFGAKQSGIGKVLKIEGNKIRVKFATVEKMLYPEELRVKTKEMIKK
jgi:hypothetical protein